MYSINRQARRGVVAAKVAICLPFIGGFLAFSVDIGYLTTIQSGLVRAADGAALAACKQLGDYTPDGTSLLDQLETAARQTLAHNPTVGAREVALPPGALEYGNANLDTRPGANGRYTNFEPYDGAWTPSSGEPRPNAVRVAVGYGANSGTESVSLFFAGLLGIDTGGASAAAVAVLAPWDSVLVFDASTSMSQNSQLQSMLFVFFAPLDVTLNLEAVWRAMDDPAPTWGQMTDFGLPLDRSYFAFNDTINDVRSSASPEAGLVSLPLGRDWSVADPATFYRPDPTTLAHLRAAVGGDAAKYNALVLGTTDRVPATRPDGPTDWHRRVAVALGLAKWNHTLHDNATIEPDEIEFTVPYPGPAGGSWYDYFNYMLSRADRQGVNEPATPGEAMRTNTPIEQQRNLNVVTEFLYDFRYGFGIKTFVNFLLDRGHLGTHLAGTPVQPFQAGTEVAQLIGELFDGNFANDDRFGLVLFDAVASRNVPLDGSVVEVGALADYLENLFGAIAPGGNTASDTSALNQAVEDAMWMLEENKDSSHVQREIVIVTAGWPTITRTASEPIYLGMVDRFTFFLQGWGASTFLTGAEEIEDTMQVIREARDRDIKVVLISLCRTSSGGTPLSGTPWTDVLEAEGELDGNWQYCRAGDDLTELTEELFTRRLPILIR